MTGSVDTNHSQWKFRSLDIGNFYEEESNENPTNYSNNCLKLTCRNCSPSWILDDVIASLTRRPVTMGQSDSRGNGSQSNARFKVVRDHFASLGWHANKTPGFFLPSWNQNDAQNVFQFFKGFLVHEAEGQKGGLENDSGFEIDAIYFNGSTITVMESFLHGNFKTKSTEREIFEEKTILAALQRIKRDQSVIESLLELHECKNCDVNYMLFFPHVTTEKVFAEMNRCNELKTWLPQSG